jgi:hypothetical protein
MDAQPFLFTLSPSRAWIAGSASMQTIRDPRARLRYWDGKGADIRAHVDERPRFRQEAKNGRPGFWLVSSERENVLRDRLRVARQDEATAEAVIEQGRRARQKGAEERPPQPRLSGQAVREQSHRRGQGADHGFMHLQAFSARRRT